MKKILSLLLILFLCITSIPPRPVYAAVKLSKAKATMEVDSTLKLSVSGTKFTTTWKTSKKAVATVDKKGLVTAISPGRTTITATVNNNKYTCLITVVDNSGPLYMIKTLYVGDRFEGLIGGYEAISNDEIISIDGDTYIAISPGICYVGDISDGYVHDYEFHVKRRLTAETYDKTLYQENYININLKNSEYVDAELRFEELDTDNDIITCYWGEWDGDNIPLWFSLNNKGKTSVIVTAYYGNGLTESIIINVTVK